MGEAVYGIAEHKGLVAVCCISACHKVATETAIAVYLYGIKLVATDIAEVVKRVVQHHRRDTVVVKQGEAAFAFRTDAGNIAPHAS